MNARLAEQVVNAHEAWIRHSVYPNDAEYELLQNLHDDQVGRDRDHGPCPCWCCCADCIEDLPPWDTTQVERLARHQQTGGKPYLCFAGHHDQPARLVPTERGWVCPDEHCGYRQLWARVADIAGDVDRSGVAPL